MNVYVLLIINDDQENLIKVFMQEESAKKFSDQYLKKEWKTFNDNEDTEYMGDDIEEEMKENYNYHISIERTEIDQELSSNFHYCPNCDEHDGWLGSPYFMCISCKEYICGVCAQDKIYIDLGYDDQAFIHYKDCKKCRGSPIFVDSMYTKKCIEDILKELNDLHKQSTTTTE